MIIDHIGQASGQANDPYKNRIKTCYKTRI